MPAISAPQCADEMLRVDQGVEAPGFIKRDHLGFHAEIARARADELQAVELARRRCQHQPAIRVQSAGLSRQRLYLAIQVDGVLLQPRYVGLAIERVHATGRMPGRAGGQLAFLEQHYVGPADLGEVVKGAGANNTAADDDRPGRGLHENGSPENAANGTGPVWLIPNGTPVAASHSAKCRAVVAGVNS